MNKKKKALFYLLFLGKHLTKTGNHSNLYALFPEVGFA
jgi:hypothetical protein